MTDILSEICSAKRDHIRRRKQQLGEQALLAATADAPSCRGFIHALRQRIAAGGFGLIAEIKKSSPSKGLIRADFHPAQLAKAYEEGGAACLSILTDEPYFQGRDDYLGEAREACALPALRKDFMLEPYQIVESRALGADCVLLIMAALSDAQAQELAAAAESLDMDVLIEVHDARETERALTRLAPRMLGINNRDLRSFRTDLAVSEQLAKMVPPGILLVGESGIHTHDDAQRLAKAGIRALLVGESLMRQEDVAQATRHLLGIST